MFDAPDHHEQADKEQEQTEFHVRERLVHQQAAPDQGQGGHPERGHEPRLPVKGRTQDEEHDHDAENGYGGSPEPGVLDPRLVQGDIGRRLRRSLRNRNFSAIRTAIQETSTIPPMW